MLEKIKQKLHSDSDNTTTQQQDNPSINEPSSNPSNHHPSSGSIDVDDQPGRLSVSGDANDRGRSSSGNVARTLGTSRSRSRNRDVFWKNSLYSGDGAPQTHKQDLNLRSKSLSVDVPHPTMAEEGMKKMPYTDWSKK